MGRNCAIAGSRGELMKRIHFSNRLVSTSLAYMLTSFVVKGLSFITTPIFTRMMGTSDYGIVSNFTTWVQFFAIFIFIQASSGLLPASVNRAQGRFDSYMKSIVIFACCSALLQIAVMMAFRRLVSDWISIQSAWFPMLAVCTVGTAFSNVCSSYFVASGKPVHKVIFTLSTAVLYVAVGLLAVVFFQDKALGRIIGMAAGYVAVIVFSLGYFLRKPLGSKEEIMGDIRYAVAFGAPLIPHLLANLVNGNADRVFLIKMCGESEAGIYSVAYSIGMVAIAIADASGDAWNPFYFQKTKEGRSGEIQPYFRIYSVTIIMCFVGVMFLAPEVMGIMAPESYQSGTSCVLYVALGICFLFLYRFPLAYEQFMSNTKFVAPMTVASAVVNVGLNAVLIPRHGMAGAAVATSVSYMILWLLHEAAVRKAIKGYNIELRDYAIPLGLAVSGFILSSLFLESTLPRYLILVAYCAGYLLVMRHFLKK